MTVQNSKIRPCRDDDQPRMLEIINAAAQRYRGAIPDDRWHEPYMPKAELDREIATGVEFCGLEIDGVLAGVMGVQAVKDVLLIRHAYVAPVDQGRGVGGELLEFLCSQTALPILVGTWAAATWAIAFYERHGFVLAPSAEIPELLRTYWSIPERQLESSVVLEKRS